MDTIYDETHRRHAGRVELGAGELVPCFEKPERAEFVLAAVAQGLSHARIVLKHILSNLAAPILVHTFLRASPDGAAGATFILVALLILTVVAILIDRRALLVSGLSYFTIAVWQIASGNAVLADYRFALTTAVIGGFLLTLGLAWTTIRRVLVSALPIPALKAILPPVAN